MDNMDNFNHVILCYRGNSLIYRIELCMSDQLFYEQIKNKVIEYKSSNGTEIIYLNNFDKVVIVL